MKYPYTVHNMLESGESLRNVAKWMSINDEHASDADKLKGLSILLKHLIKEPSCPVDHEHNK